MKKLFLFSLLAACSVGTIERSPGTEFLMPLNDEPVGCTLLYRLEVDAVARNQRDAIQFLENKIVEQPRTANAYWITSIRMVPRDRAVVGKQQAYVVNANVYRCPEHGRFVTKSDVEKASDYKSRR